MNRSPSTCVLPTLLWCPAFDANQTSGIGEKTVSFVSFGYRMDTQCTRGPPHLLQAPVRETVDRDERFVLYGGSRVL